MNAPPPSPAPDDARDETVAAIMLAMSDAHSGSAAEAEVIAAAIMEAIDQRRIPRVSLSPRRGTKEWRADILRMGAECERLGATRAASALRLEEFYTS